MDNLIDGIQTVDWDTIRQSMDQNGYAILPGLLTGEECEDLKFDYDNPNGYRKTVIMERYRFGLGEYKYFDCGHCLKEAYQKWKNGSIQSNDR